jgi:hypothetical protein
MNGHRRQGALRPWLMAAAVLALIAGPVILYRILPLAGISAATVSGIVTIVAIKHLGLIAMVLAPIYALLRRRFRRRSSHTAPRAPSA